jgi:hypothetical protein
MTQPRQAQAVEMLLGETPITAPSVAHQQRGWDDVIQNLYSSSLESKLGIAVLSPNLSVIQTSR